MVDDDRQRYREAAEEALQQLDWCIGYLHGIRKRAISGRLARNRAYIRRNLLQRATESVPSELSDTSDQAVVLQ